MRTPQLILTALILTLTACSLGQVDNSNSRSETIPTADSISIVYRDYSSELLFTSWKHNSSDSMPAFTIDEEFTRINYAGKIVDVPYQIRNDSIEVFEHHESETSKGVITNLTKDSLTIKWTTGDVNHYVSK